MFSYHLQLTIQRYIILAVFNLALWIKCSADASWKYFFIIFSQRKGFPRKQDFTFHAKSLQDTLHKMLNPVLAKNKNMITICRLLNKPREW